MLLHKSEILSNFKLLEMIRKYALEWVKTVLQSISMIVWAQNYLEVVKYSQIWMFA